ncbi:helix-turn-helix domain-containing protein [Mesobacillus foraminis]|uniref:helix-turn-helix transcriptional regulator n=1 Tax=Mesobacillus foraminis TaxID=279826 RepID=UPI001BEA9371|nr:helix-turn-helix domain-containing protein [Mesobacillus foraminis]MBT2755879.1 helix-turn-helix domain-containing protein [Mesobacillus foraminis]
MDKPLKVSERYIGSYIRETVIPKKMSLKVAAELLGVDHPALSSLLNGHASLSPDMAERLERAFGISAHKLMDMQAAHKTKLANEKGLTSSTRSYTRPFMQIKANDIESWASTIKARTRFAVFLRTLINSTGLKIKKIDFPGNDDAERPGWDGFLETEEGMPWIPAGLSGWEFGTKNNPKQKADKDYLKSIEQNPPSLRMKTTFVFVTPMRWNGKESWRKQRQAEKNWKDVMVFDGSDLEQWLEQSIPGQAWLAGEMGMPAQGVISLDECREQWIADTEPQLSEDLFNTFIERAKAISIKKLSQSDPLIIASDSTIEALAFLSSLFSPDDTDLSWFRDRIAVFTEHGALSKLASKPSDFIAVITNREVEREFAPYKKDIRSIIVYPRNAISEGVDIFLEPLNHDAFTMALEKMGCNRDQINRLSHESGKSLTVLRRRLSSLDAIRTPEWASDKEIAKTLSGLLFAGAWEANNESDKVILSLLAGDLEYEKLETEFVKLLLLDNSPVWSIGHTRGLVSKIDTLYAINRYLAWKDIEQFLHVAQLVLSEDDPSLDLPEEDRWAAGIYGKTREISSVLRKGISETLVLLAVHGNSLFQERMGNDIQYKIEVFVKSLLCPLTVRKLEAQSSDLPLYAEASPEVFLQILEDDLNSENPQSLGLMRPVSTGVFGRNPRTGLLWALESIAWSPEYLVMVIRILAKLSKPKINDNWVNKPIESLSSIFRCWMPQTAASLDQRTAAFEYLVREFPDIAWSLCIEQFNGAKTIGTYSYKPLWRTDAHGAGEPVGGKERCDFVMKALQLALNWQSYTAEKLGDLVASIGQLPDQYHQPIWALIETWGNTATESEKAILREKIRTSIYTRRAKSDNKQTVIVESARTAYELLEPTDIILRHEWLFRNPWVEESYDELEDVDLDYRARDARIEALRREALTVILTKRGVQGVLILAGRGECANIIGGLLSNILSGSHEVLKVIDDILAIGPLEDSIVRQSVISGMLHGLASQGEIEQVSLLLKRNETIDAVSLLLLAPFDKNIWDILETLSVSDQERYWKRIVPVRMGHLESENLLYAIDHLISVYRPRAAFKNIQHNLKAIPPNHLFRLMSAITNSSEEPTGDYMLESYHVIRAFKLLTESGKIPVDKMAGLEFQFIDAFSSTEHKIRNLEKHIEEHPELFVQAVAMAYKRTDGGEDPAELRAPNQQVKEQRANAAFKLLDKLSAIPGNNSDGQLDSDRIREWVRKVRESAKELSRGDACDWCLGNLFSKAPIGEDGIWPIEPVRKVLDRIVNEQVSRGLVTGLYNAGGAHWRGEGGDDERKLAGKYGDWAKALEFSYPRVAVLLRRVSKLYLHDAIEEDRRAGITRRLLN